MPQWQQDKLTEETNSSYTASLNSDLYFKFLYFIEISLHTEDRSMPENTKAGFPKTLIFNLLIFHSF